jgi:hypothetical protein
MFEEYEEAPAGPAELDRAAIVQRLAGVSQKAINDGLFEVARKFTGVEAMPASAIATNVLQALNAISEKPESERLRFQHLVQELEIVAINLKNLWQG